MGQAFKALFAIGKAHFAIKSAAKSKDPREMERRLERVMGLSAEALEESVAQRGLRGESAGAFWVGLACVLEGSAAAHAAIASKGDAEAAREARARAEAALGMARKERARTDRSSFGAAMLESSIRLCSKSAALGLAGEGRLEEARGVFREMREARGKDEPDRFAEMAAEWLGGGLSGWALDAMRAAGAEGALDKRTRKAFSAGGFHVAAMRKEVEAELVAARESLEARRRESLSEELSIGEPGALRERARLREGIEPAPVSAPTRKPRL